MASPIRGEGVSELTDNGWVLARSSERDIDMLMAWFPDEQSTTIWGGPHFRYPFTRETFIEDCHWHEMATYSLRGPDGVYAGFGQYYDRHGRINLARLVANPGMRGQGIGTRLVSMLMTASAEELSLDEYSLYVYKDNIPAYRCYRALGFREQEFPEDGPLSETAYYLTRPVTAAD